MSFVTPEFAFFLLIICVIYFFLPSRLRLIFLLLVSYIFYASASFFYLSVLLLSTLFNFSTAYLISFSKERRGRTLIILNVAVGIDVLLLLFFKNFGYFISSFVSIEQLPRAIAHDALLPLGLSFYTFQQIAYNIDVYRNRVEPEKNLGVYSLFVCFFSYIASGPIVRAKEILPQLHAKNRFNPTYVTEGLRLILWGVFKKTVIADRLAVYVDVVYNNPHAYSGPVLILATLFFSFQLYVDFSAYTNIALGIARILGFILPENFRQPYLSQSLSEFWQRWHISLSTWLRDYMFFPLGRYFTQLTNGKHPRLIQFLLNITIMGLIGFWHGSAWTMVIWGALHGFGLWIDSIVRSRQGATSSQKWYEPQNIIRTLLTFSIVSFLWIFFRANILEDAIYIISHLFSITGFSLTSMVAPFSFTFNDPKLQFALSVTLIGLISGVDIFNAYLGLQVFITRLPRLVRLTLYYGTISTIIIFGVFGAATQFVYFKF